MALSLVASKLEMSGTERFGDGSRGGLHGGSLDLVSSFSHFVWQASVADICCLSYLSVPSFLKQ